MDNQQEQAPQEQARQQPDPYQEQVAHQWPSSQGQFQAPSWVDKAVSRLKEPSLTADEVKQVLQQEGQVQPMQAPNTAPLAAAQRRTSRGRHSTPSLDALSRQTEGM